MSEWRDIVEYALNAKARKREGAKAQGREKKWFGFIRENLCLRIVVVYLFLFALPGMRTAAGQPAAPYFTIDQTNITSGATITGDKTVPGGTCLLSIGGTMKVSAATANFLFNSSATNIPVSLASVHLTNAGSVSVISSQPVVTLTTSAQTIFNTLIGLSLAQNYTTIDYQIPVTGSMNTYAWNAGTYSTQLTFNTTGALLCSSSFSTALSIWVKPFINFTPPPVSLNVTALSNYNTGISTGVSANAVYTVPLGIQVMANGGANFSYSNDKGYATPAALPPVTTIAATPTLPAGGPSVLVLNNTGFQSLTPASGVAVPAGNTQGTTVKYTISAADMQTYFKQYGVYTVNLKYNLYDPTTNTNYGTQPTTTLTVNVPDLGSIAANNDSLTFRNAGDYSNGVSSTGQISISKTTPYDVYVSASGSNLVNGNNTIPVNIVSIGPASGQTGITPVTLSATPQKIIAGAQPDLNRIVSLNYSIGPAGAATLIGKAPGTYATTLTYSFTSP